MIAFLPTIFAILLVSAVIAASLPRIATMHSTDAIIPPLRRWMITGTALASIAFASFGACYLATNVKEGGTYTLNSSATSANQRSLDPVVSRLLSAIRIEQATQRPLRADTRWCSAALKSDFLWEDSTNSSLPSVPTEIKSAVEQTIVLACLFRNNPKQINVHVGQNPDEIARWEALTASLTPKFKARVRLDYRPEPKSTNTTQLNASTAMVDGGLFTLRIVSPAPGGDTLLPSLKVLLAECTNKCAPSQAYRLITHLQTSSSTNTADLVLIPGPGWIALCPEQAQTGLRQLLGEFATTENTSPVVIGGDGSDLLLRYEAQTWSGLSLSGLTTAQDWAGWNAPVVATAPSTKRRLPLILTKADCAIILINQNFSGFTDHTPANGDPAGALARAALIRSIDRLGSLMGRLSEIEPQTKQTTLPEYTGPYLTQQELADLFGQMRIEPVVTGLGLLAIAFCLASLHATALIRPKPTPDGNAEK